MRQKNKILVSLLLFSCALAWAQESDFETSTLPIDPSVTGDTDELPPIASEVPVEKQKVEVPKIKKPEAPKEQEVSEASEKEKALQNEKILATPTRNTEEYEKARKEMLYLRNIPSKAIQVSYVPRTYYRADLRVPHLSQRSNTENLELHAFRLAGEYFLIKEFGMASVGAEVGFSGTKSKDGFKGTQFAFLQAGPLVEYQFRYLKGQWVVPIVRAKYEYNRYSYRYGETKVSGSRFLPRFDVGGMIYLNFLETSSAADMDTQWNVKRTYIAVTMSMVSDSSKEMFDLSERTTVFSLRFEL